MYHNAFRKSPYHQALKYRNKRTNHAGFSFASKLEAAVYDLLILMEKSREIEDLKCQPHVFLTDARIEMIPDFCANKVNSGEIVYFEAKGYQTDVWRIKKKLWSTYGPGPLLIYMGTAKRPFLAETIIPAL